MAKYPILKDMDPDIFASSSYKKYLEDYILAQPKRGRGLKVRMAEVMRCKLAFVSQVLRGDHHFNLEQGTLLSEFLGHSHEERHFFLLLLQRERTGSAKLREYFQAQLEEILNRRLQMKTRFQTTQPMSEKEQIQYYSTWYYAAVHILITIPEFRTKSAIAKRLQLDTNQVSQILDFLCGCGLAVQAGSEYHTGSARIYLGNDSPLTSKVHTNWRIRSFLSHERETKEELHYTSVVSLSQADVKRIRERLVKEIEAIRGIVKDSKEEKLFTICMDWFEV